MQPLESRTPAAITIPSNRRFVDCVAIVRQKPFELLAIDGAQRTSFMDTAIAANTNGNPISCQGELHVPETLYNSVKPAKSGNLWAKPKHFLSAGVMARRLA
jgi:hypothetical protein